MQDGGRPPYLICKNAVIRQQIDRFSPNLTCTRRKFFLFFVSPEKSYCWKFKMAADRHNGFLKNAVIRERIERFSQNLTHTSRKLLLSWGSPQNLRCWKSKMAADHHIGVRYNTITRNLLHRFSRNLTYRCGKIFLLCWWRSIPDICESKMAVDRHVGFPQWVSIYRTAFSSPLKYTTIKSFSRTLLTGAVSDATIDYFILRVYIPSPGAEILYSIATFDAEAANQPVHGKLFLVVYVQFFKKAITRFSYATVLNVLYC
jgi:hypothetical protein